MTGKITRGVERKARLIIAALLLSACGATTGTDGSGEAHVAPTTTLAITTTAPPAGSDFDCPATIPPQPGLVTTESEDVTYSENFPAPDPWPAEYPHAGMVWYGTPELWTALAVDGDHGIRKSVWWSANFPGGIEEEQPEVFVTWTRLDTEEPVVIDNDGSATNAYIPEEGWFMIAGIDPNQAGCWEVEATYKGASLAYVYQRK